MAKMRNFYKVKPITEGKRNIIRQHIFKYNIETVVYKISQNEGSYAKAQWKG